MTKPGLRGDDERALDQREPGDATMEKDPVCGMLVDPQRAVGKRTTGGKTYYFCSASCLAKFDAKPERFVSGEAKEKT